MFHCYGKIIYIWHSSKLNLFYTKVTFLHYVNCHTYFHRMYDDSNDIIYQLDEAPPPTSSTTTPMHGWQVLPIPSPDAIQFFLWGMLRTVFALHLHRICLNWENKSLLLSPTFMRCCNGYGWVISLMSAASQKVDTLNIYKMCKIKLQCCYWYNACYHPLSHSNVPIFMKFMNNLVLQTTIRPIPPNFNQFDLILDILFSVGSTKKLPSLLSKLDP